MAWRAPLKEIRAEEQLLNEQLYQEARPKIAGFIDRLQRARTAEDFFRLHLDVLKEFAARQIAVSETLPGHRAYARGEIARLSQLEPKPVDDLRVMTERLALVERQERVADGLQHALRVVTDGIAWRALDYNRAAITVLGRGTRVGRLAIGPGFDTELGALGLLWERDGLFAIHNDMTNCLRHGDLTVIRFVSPKEINLAEVKVSNLASAGAQLQRMDEVIELLRTGVYPAAGSDLPTQILHVPDPYDTFLADLSQLITVARRDRFAWSQPHPALAVAAIDYGVRDAEGRAAAVFETMKRELKWDDPSRGFWWTGAQRRMRDRDVTPSNFAPLSIYPLPAQDVADLILGFLDTLVYLDIPELERAFAARGLEATVARPPESERLFLRATDGEFTVNVAPGVREVMLNEMETPDSLIAGVRSLLAFAASGAAAGERILAAFADETGVWS